MTKFIISIDQGTTSSRAILFNLKGKPVFTSQKEFTQYFPKNGWVEHNPEEIWSTTKKTLNDAIKKAKRLKGIVLAIGITNQRETTVLWDKKTGKAVYKAIVWQDRRQEEFCQKLRKQKKENLIYKSTGLLIDSYFSGTKIKWILDNVPIARKLMIKRQLLFGTIDSFLIWRLTKGKVHATDATNASRTMIYNISTNRWDDSILKILKIPKHILPEVKNCSDDFGFTHPSITEKAIPITGVVGDEHSASIGQCCFDPGSLKTNFAMILFSLKFTLDAQTLTCLVFVISILPNVKNCADNYGSTHPSITGKSIPITGVVGDQQSAAIGQCCFEPGSLKSTYGTGAFVLLNTGNKKIYSKNRLLTTIAYRIKGKTTYAMEGSIFIAGAGVQWLRDRMKFFKKAKDTEKIIKSLKDN